MSLIALLVRVGRAVWHSVSLALDIYSIQFHAFHNDRPLDFGILMLNLAREMARSLRTADNMLVEKS